MKWHIGAGDLSSPVGEEPFPNGGRVNMGAYGGTGEASKSRPANPVFGAIIAGGTNGDCLVDFGDLRGGGPVMVAGGGPERYNVSKSRGHIGFTFGMEDDRP